MTRIPDELRDLVVAGPLAHLANPGTFLAEHAVLRATATVSEGGARELLDRIGGIGPWVPSK